MKFACTCPSPVSVLSHFDSSACFAVILSFFMQPFSLLSSVTV